MKIAVFAANYPNSDEVLKKFCSKTFKMPYSIELLYLPFLLFRYRIELVSLSGKEKKEAGLFLVDLVQGVPMNIKKNTLFDLQGGMRKEFEEFMDLLPSIDNSPKNMISIQKLDVKDEQVLPAALEERAAIERGKRLLRYDLMRVAGSLRYRSLEILPLPKTKVLYYPYWLIYYRNKKEKMEFNVLDAVSGQKEEGQIVQSIKIGLVKKGTPPKSVDHAVEAP